MKLSAIALSVAIFSSAGALAFAGPAPVAPAAAQPPVRQYAVRLHHQWELADGQDVLRSAVPSLGTVVGPGSVVTHNHFNPLPAGATSEAMQVARAGQPASQVPMTRVAATVLNAETNRLALGGEVLAGPVAPLAAPSTLAGLAPGDRVVVVYWDDTAGALAERSFPVVMVEAGVMTLADPEHVINGGDSGGGAFYQGELVGNTWGVLVDHARQPLGLFNVALLPGSGLAGQ